MQGYRGNFFAMPASWDNLSVFSLILSLTFARMTTVYLKKKVSRRVESGHPWVFANEVGRIEGALDAGDIVDLLSHDGKFIGRGYANPRSQILVRLLTRDRKEIIDAAFFTAGSILPGNTGNGWDTGRTAAWYLEKPTSCPP